MYEKTPEEFATLFSAFEGYKKRLPDCRDIQNYLLPLFFSHSTNKEWIFSERIIHEALTELSGGRFEIPKEVQYVVAKNALSILNYLFTKYPDHNTEKAIRHLHEKYLPILFEIKGEESLQQLILTPFEIFQAYDKLEQKGVPHNSIIEALRKFIEIMGRAKEIDSREQVPNRPYYYLDIIQIVDTASDPIDLINFLYFLNMRSNLPPYECDAIMHCFEEYKLSPEQRNRVIDAVNTIFEKEWKKDPNPQMKIKFLLKYLTIAIAKGSSIENPTVQDTITLLTKLQSSNFIFAEILDNLNPAFRFDRTYQTEMDIAIALIEAYNEHHQGVNAKALSHFINNAHDNGLQGYSGDPRAELVAKLTPDAMISLIADGGAHLPNRYYPKRFQRTSQEMEAIRIGNHDYGIAMYTTTFLEIYQHLERLRNENQSEYVRLLKANHDRLIRYSFMLARFGQIEKNIADYPEVFVSQLREILINKEVSLEDWYVFSTAIAAGLASNKSEQYQKLLADAYALYSTSESCCEEGLLSIGFMFKKFRDSFPESKIKRTFEKAFENFPPPSEIPVPDWSKEKEIRVLLLYNADEIAHEGLPGALTEYQKEGYNIVSEDRSGLKWEMQKVLADGRKIRVTITTEPISAYEQEKERPHFVALLMHSYHSDRVYMPNPSRTEHNIWQKTVFYDGYCGSVRDLPRVLERGYTGPHIGDIDKSEGYVNLLATLKLIDIFANGNYSSWDEISKAIKGFQQTRGIRLPELGQELNRYVSDNITLLKGHQTETLMPSATEEHAQTRPSRLPTTANRKTSLKATNERRRQQALRKYHDELAHVLRRQNPR